MSAALAVHVELPSKRVTDFSLRGLHTHDATVGFRIGDREWDAGRIAFDGLGLQCAVLVNVHAHIRTGGHSPGGEIGYDATEMQVRQSGRPHTVYFRRGFAGTWREHEIIPVHFHLPERIITGRIVQAFRFRHRDGRRHACIGQENGAQLFRDRIIHSHAGSQIDCASGRVIGTVVRIHLIAFTIVGFQTDVDTGGRVYRLGNPHPIGDARLIVFGKPCGQRIQSFHIAFGHVGYGERVERDLNVRRTLSQSQRVGVERHPNLLDVRSVRVGWFPVMPIVFAISPLNFVVGNRSAVLGDFQASIPPHARIIPLVLHGRRSVFKLVRRNVRRIHFQNGFDLRSTGHGVAGTVGIVMVDVGFAFGGVERQILLVEHGLGRSVRPLQSFAEQWNLASWSRLEPLDDGS